jgi:hypothetical protein
MGVCMKHAVEMGSGVMIYIQRFINIVSCIQQFTKGIHAETQRQQNDLISLLSSE